MAARSALWRASVVIALLTGSLFVAIFLRDELNPSLVQVAIDRLGILAPIAFIVMFAVATVLFVPGALFALAGGVIFGPVWGTLLNLLGATLGATIAFLVARYVAADWVAVKAGGRLKQIVEGVEAEGWRFVALTRLLPIVPFNLLNYALGLTRIPLLHYVLATAICMVPGAIAFSWLGHAGRAAMEGDTAAIHYGLLGLAALAGVAFLPRLVRRIRGQPEEWISRRELQRLLMEEPRPIIVDVRGPDEFHGPLGNIPTALNIPLGELPARSNGLRNPGGLPLVIVCRTDKRSQKAASMLRATGIANVRVLRGGMEGWANKTH